MKTIRDILDDKMFPSGEVVKKSTGKVDPLMTQALVKIRNDNIDQALKEIEELLVESLPKEITTKMNKYHHQTQIDGYNQAIDDYKRNIKARLQ